MNQADGVGDTVEAVEVGSVMFALIAAARTVEERLEKRLERHGLSIAKLNVLSRLAEAGEPLTLSEVATRLACVRSNVTQLVDRLEAEGLVRREADRSDRRIIRAVLTAEGRRKQLAGARELSEIHVWMEGALVRHDPGALLRALQALA